MGPWLGNSEENMMGKKSKLGHEESAYDQNGQVCF